MWVTMGIVQNFVECRHSKFKLLAAIKYLSEISKISETILFWQSWALMKTSGGKDAGHRFIDDVAET